MYVGKAILLDVVKWHLYHGPGLGTALYRSRRMRLVSIAGSRYFELDGEDHIYFAGDADALIDEIEELVTGSRGTHDPDHVLATVMFTDIVRSTEHAARLGDPRWRPGSRLEPRVPGPRDPVATGSPRRVARVQGGGPPVPGLITTA